MEPTPRIERNTCTLIELVMLVCVIEAERWAAEKLSDILRTGGKPEALRTSFVNQERIRRTLAHENSLARCNSPAYRIAASRRNTPAQR